MLSSQTPHTTYSLSNDSRPFELPASSWTRNISSAQAQLRSARETRAVDRPPTSENNNNARSGSLASYIPALRRSASKLVRTTPSPPLVQPTRWDEYSGEPTRNGAGHPSQVHPSTFDEALLNDRSYNVTICGGPDKTRKTSWSERAVRIGKDALSLDTRPPWKGGGGGGRTARVDPVRDTQVNKYTAVKDLSKSGLPADSDSDTSLGSNPNKVDAYLGPIDSSSVSPMMPSELMREYGDDGVSPIASGAGVGSRLDTYTANTGANSQRTSSRGTIVRKPVASPSNSNKENQHPAQLNSHFSWTTMADSDADAESIRTTRTPRTVAPDQMQSSDSRFSWTTVNTTTTYQQDGPLESPPPFPLLSSRAWKTNNQAQYMPDKPLTPPEHKQMLDAKSLPEPPAVSKIMSHVDALTAQRDDLSLQHKNIEKVMKELQQIDRASPLEVDWSTKKANLKRLEECKVCVEEIEREEHEVGRALARARRKAEREEGIDSGLWVRRVTG